MFACPLAEPGCFGRLVRFKDLQYFFGLASG